MFDAGERSGDVSAGRPDHSPEQSAAWLVRIVLGRRSGVTLWEGRDTHDRVLAIDSYVLLFADKSRLHRFLGAGTPSNLAGSASLRGILMHWETRARRATYTYRFDRAAAAVQAERWSAWSLPTCSVVLNCLNLLSDLAYSVGDDEALDVLDAGSPLSRLADSLTFMDEEHLPDLEPLSRSPARGLFTQVVRRLDPRILRIC